MSMNKLMLSLSLLLIAACNPIEQEHDDLYGVGFINVDETQWSLEHSSPYPFTVAYGEISCTSHPSFGREVYFAPDGFTDESYVGIPLNKAAVNSLKHDDMLSNVPYSIKTGADLSVAVNIGLKVCDEQQEFLKNNG